MNRVLIKMVTLVLLCGCICLPSVNATWTYTKEVGESDYDLGYIGMSEFTYAPEEVLPGDKESTELHENHMNLLKNIVNHIDYGLNATKKPIVRELLEDGAGVVYSNQNVTGGNLKHMLLGSSDVESLMFCVQYITDTEYHVFSFSGIYVKRENVGTYIDVYKTITSYNGTKWEATRSYSGTAAIDVVYANGTEQLVSIDISTWK